MGACKKGWWRVESVTTLWQIQNIQTDALGFNHLGPSEAVGKTTICTIWVKIKLGQCES